MFVLDTHILVWWINRSSDLDQDQHSYLDVCCEMDGFGVSSISVWEIAKLVEYERLSLDRPVPEWVSTALATPNLDHLGLDPEIAIDSTTLPGEFHNDPADQMIVSTARVYECTLFTADDDIVDYANVETTDFS